MMDVRIYTLVHKELTGEISSAEALELSSLKSQMPVLDVANDLSLIWNASKEYFPSNQWNAAGAKANFKQRIQAERLSSSTASATKSNSLLRYASVGILLLALTALVYYITSSSTAEVELTPKIENIEYASLQDDTKFWTEEGSSVAVTNFSDSERKVSLEGNAIFEVAKDSERPFTIDMGEGVYAQVLGTSFKATSAHNNGIGIISVREGTVKLFTTGAYAAEQILTAGQTGEINANGSKNRKFTSSTPITLSSADKLQLRNISLDKAFPLLGKYFGVTFDISNAELACVYSNTLVEETNLDDLLNTISDGYPKISVESLPGSHYVISGSCE